MSTTRPPLRDNTATERLTSGVTTPLTLISSTIFLLSTDTRGKRSGCPISITLGSVVLMASLCESPGVPEPAEWQPAPEATNRKNPHRQRICLICRRTGAPVIDAQTD